MKGEFKIRILGLKIHRDWGCGLRGEKKGRGECKGAVYLLEEVRKKE